MALSQGFPSAGAVGERAETALRVPVGVASPLWVMFGAAASVGVAYWWMTRWTRAVNVEALAALAPIATLEPPSAVVAAPIEVIAGPAPVEAVVEATAVAEPADAAATEIAEAVADDLTVISGIGRKLMAALAERGVTRFAQIAAWTAKDLAEVDAALSLKGRAAREAWVAQAKRLADPK